MSRRRTKLGSASKEALIHGADLRQAATELYRQHDNLMPDTVMAVQSPYSVRFTYEKSSLEEKLPNWCSRLFGAFALNGAKLHATFSDTGSTVAWDTFTRGKSGYFETFLFEGNSSTLVVDEPRTLELIERFLATSPDDLIMEQATDLSDKERAQLVEAINNLVSSVTKDVRGQINSSDFTVDYKLPHELIARIYHKRLPESHDQTDQKVKELVSASFSIVPQDSSLTAPDICEAYCVEGPFGIVARFDSDINDSSSNSLQDIVGIMEVITKQTNKGFPSFGGPDALIHDIERSIQPVIEGLSPEQLGFLLALRGLDK